MPSLNDLKDIFNRERDVAQQNVSNIQDHIRRKYLKELEEYTDRDTIIYACDFGSLKLAQMREQGIPLPSDVFSISGNDIQSFMSALHGLKRNKLDLILHSPGGSLEAAEQIVNYLRSKYEHIRAIIPQSGMSAATMIACSCDQIVMGKHSAIGPIDPQITFRGFTAPAQAIIDEFEQIKAEVSKDPGLAALWVRRLDSYPPGFLEQCGITVILAKEKVCEWLETFMFKGDENAEQKASTISEWLGDAKIHKTHGRPISIETAREKGLKVVELEKDQDLQEKVLSVFHATILTFETTIVTHS